MDVSIRVTLRGPDYKSPFWAIGEDVKALPQKEFDHMIKKNEKAMTLNTSGVSIF
jgi:hypothetical protein